MTIEELLAMEDIEDMGVWKDSIRDEYANVSEGYQAKVKEMEATIAELEKKYEETAARNYELMLAVTDKPEAETEEAEEVDAEEEAAEAIEELFTDKEGA